MLIKLAALGGLGYAGYRYFDKRRREQNEAFAEGEAGGENFAQVRNAGPGAMKDKPNKDTWDQIDEESDQATPASDPPANY
ncbi:hypothetical protein [Aurantiacibacter aquimixticola]|uniref:Uncharacterized protein n=1 Tax=Aurantiacibacter aquimixticola TaxID=1958945 RepID=A0A419RUL3_9SPHN|nr:hypothetical protein [Aurantiacibacter aquimixticola]RJY09478.1 hypothetical protein D6201_09005 [Aurantiacibacter aquimixticola]